MRVDGIETDSVTQIGETTATYYGTIHSGTDIIEFGFYYATDTTTTNLEAGTATAVMCYNNVGAPLQLTDSIFSKDLTELTNRSAYYFRAYMKDAMGNYIYGKKIRYHSERRDFSLTLDGDGDALAMDETSTAQFINDWGSSATSFSLEFWLRKGDATVSKQVLCDNTSLVGGYALSLENGRITLENHLGSFVASTLEIQDLAWHYIGVTYNATDVLIYIDDSVSATLTLTVLDPLVNNCFIGAAYTGLALADELNGNLDAMRFWNRTLTAEEISALAYDIVQEGSVPNTVQLVGSGEIIAGLPWSSLRASLGFNVKSTVEGATAIPLSLSYKNQDDLHNYAFFHNDARLGNDVVAFNMVAFGNAKPSPFLPRVNWRYNATDSIWTTSNHWSGYAYPGEGVGAGVFSDVSAGAMINDSIYCKYAIINTSSHAATVTLTPPDVQILVDREDEIGTYAVSDNALVTLTVLQGIIPSLFIPRVDNEDADIIIENGSMEVHE